jgi:hypothetical protein
VFIETKNLNSFPEIFPEIYATLPTRRNAALIAFSALQVATSAAIVRNLVLPKFLNTISGGPYQQSFEPGAVVPGLGTLSRKGFPREQLNLLNVKFD